MFSYKFFMFELDFVALTGELMQKLQTFSYAQSKNKYLEKQPFKCNILCVHVLNAEDQNKLPVLATCYK